jgi:hypothetical protein
LDETAPEAEDKKEEDSYVPGKKLVEELYQEGETLGEREKYEGNQTQREHEKDLVTEQREKFLSIYKESDQTGEGEQQDDQFDPNNIRFKKGLQDEEQDMDLKMPGDNGDGERPKIQEISSSSNDGKSGKKGTKSGSSIVEKVEVAFDWETCKVEEAQF